jgi:hypothetical protein
VPGTGSSERKHSTRIKISSLRSLRGGTSTGVTLEPIEQVLAEGPTGCGGFQITLCGSDDANVDTEGLHSPDSLEFPSWSTLKSATCVSGGSSPTSSKKSAPPSTMQAGWAVSSWRTRRNRFRMGRRNKAPLEPVRVSQSGEPYRNRSDLPSEFQSNTRITRASADPAIMANSGVALPPAPPTTT